MGEEKIMAKGKGRWFEAGEKLGWHKGDSQDKRRRIALRNRNGDLLATARALMALANVTQDKETERKARADSKYFYNQYKRKGVKARRK